MTGDTNRDRVDEPRADDGREWEVFLREAVEEPLRHVGSVTAPDVDAAHEHAAALFDRAAHTLWLCPADEVARFTTREL
ncbi:MAG: Htur_1727 family rSAM-partnered candidate RiPP [Haloferacaceae archaeon]